MTKEQIEQVILALIVSLTVFFAIFFFWLMPMLRYTYLVDKKVIQHRNELGAIAVEANEQARMRQELKNRRVSIDGFAQQLLSETGPSLLEILNEAGQGMDISFERVKPLDTVVLEGDAFFYQYLVQRVELIMRVPYHVLGHFVSKLEQRNPALAVQSIEISSFASDAEIDERYRKAMLVIESFRTKDVGVAFGS